MMDTRLIDGENWVKVESVCDTIKALEFALKDARAEIDRLNHKVELLQGPGEGAV